MIYNLFIATVTSLISLVLPILLLLYMTIDNKKEIRKYTSQKKRSFEVSFATQTKSLKKNSPTPIKPKKIQNKPKIKPKPININKLFDDIDTKKYCKTTKKIKPKKQPKYKTTPISQQQKIKNQKSIDKINKMINATSTTTQINNQDAIYNEYRGKVNDIIQIKWIETISTHTNNNKAIVSIVIDKNGRITSYKIRQLSNSDAFNEKVKNFMDLLQQTKFPEYKNGKTFSIRLKLSEKTKDET